MRGNKTIRFLTAALFLAGLAVLLYPPAADYWNQYREKRLIRGYETSVTGMDEEGRTELLEAARAYNKRQAANPVPDAFAKGEHETNVSARGEHEADVFAGEEHKAGAFATEEHEADAEYETLLNCNGDGVMAYLEIPCLEVRLPILHGTGSDALMQGVGHLEGSSLPVGGENTHAVLAGHRGLPSSALFTDLNRMVQGDLFYIHVLGEVLAYEVDRIETVKPEETDSLAIVQGRDYVTLVTCTPYGVNSHRLLVRGCRTEYRPAVYEAASAAGSRPFSTAYLAPAILGLSAVGIAVLLLGLRDVRRRKRRKTVDRGSKADKGTCAEAGELPDKEKGRKDGPGEI